MPAESIESYCADGYRNEVPRFQIFLNCYNCERPYARYLQCVPAEITTEDDLIESGLLAKQAFTCGKCDSSIGTVTGVKVEWISIPY